MRDKIIRVSDTEYEIIREVVKKIEERGIGDLPKEIEEALKRCPECGGQLDGIEISYYQCSNCGYKRGSFNINWKNVAMGAIAGIGATIAAYYLLKKKPTGGAKK